MNTRTPSSCFQRRRPIYALSIVLVIATGLLWRSRFVSLPDFVSKYGGDALWALVVFLVLGFCFRCVTTWRIALIALAVAWSVEFSQLYHAPWIDSVRSTRLGALALGSSFNPPDLLAYVVGIAIGAGVERVCHRRK